MINNLNSIIDQNDSGIVVKETSVKISDEKLKNMLSKAYERAQQDANKIVLNKYYGVFLSIAGTLVVTLVTSEFRSLGCFSSGAVTDIVWVICIICALVGFILLWLNVKEKTSYKTNARDQAVDEIMSNIQQIK